MICRSSLVRKSYSRVRGPAIIFVCLFIYMLKMKLASWIFLFLLRLHSNGRQYAILPGMSTYTWSVHLSTSWIFSSLIHSFNWMKCWVNWLTTCPLMKDVQKQIFIFIKKFPWFNFEIIKQIFIVTLLVRNISISGVIFLLAYSWDGIKPIFHSLKSSFASLVDAIWWEIILALLILVPSGAWILLEGIICFLEGNIYSMGIFLFPLKITKKDKKGEMTLL